MHYQCSITDQYPTGPKSQINEANAHQTAKRCTQTHILESLNKRTISVDSVRMILSVCVMLFQFKHFLEKMYGIFLCKTHRHNALHRVLPICFFEVAKVF